MCNPGLSHPRGFPSSGVPHRLSHTKTVGSLLAGDTELHTPADLLYLLVPQVVGLLPPGRRLPLVVREAGSAAVSPAVVLTKLVHVCLEQLWMETERGWKRVWERVGEREWERERERERKRRRGERKNVLDGKHDIPA